MVMQTAPDLSPTSVAEAKTSHGPWTESLRRHAELDWCLMCRKGGPGPPGPYSPQVFFGALNWDSANIEILMEFGKSKTGDKTKVECNKP